MLNPSNDLGSNEVGSNLDEPQVESVLNKNKELNVILAKESTNLQW